MRGGGCSFYLTQACETEQWPLGLICLTDSQPRSLFVSFQVQ